MKKCKACRQPFTPARPLQRACSPGCALELVILSRAQEELKEKKAERRKDAETRARLKSRKELEREAQAEVNKFIRARDAEKPCISCGRFHGGQWHAGHYLTTGARPELRFNELNIHKQCQPCNTHLHGNLVLYRVNLIERIGLDMVEWLEGPHEPLKLTREDLIELRNTYRRKAKELERNGNLQPPQLLPRPNCGHTHLLDGSPMLPNLR